MLVATVETCSTSDLLACGDFSTALREGGLRILRCIPEEYKKSGLQLEMTSRTMSVFRRLLGSTVDSRPCVSPPVRGFSHVLRGGGLFSHIAGSTVDTRTASVCQGFWKFLHIFCVWLLGSRG